MSRRPTYVYTNLFKRREAFLEMLPCQCLADDDDDDDDDKGKKGGNKVKLITSRPLDGTQTNKREPYKLSCLLAFVI